ncbi:hypothetical protein EKO27_g6248 [Xylaria grammica]|uniref:RRM domain-containing protein n=1 Tax=Xylaria grammica TaxID=363999 RepID=A0A439D322_9PEZI|nr:hypothetical protein EKO27_g6248 [Xylaria grammica]
MHISKANVQPTGVLPLSRYFSQTASVAEEGREDLNDPVESAFQQAAEQNGSTSSIDAPLQSSPTEGERAVRDGFTVFVSNMTFDATETHLHEAFGKYGEILHANIGRDGRGLSRGFGFITFSDRQAAERAVSEAHNSFWHGRRITVDHRKDGPSAPQKRSPSAPTKSIYIGNIPYEASDADLNQLFRTLKNVQDVRVAVDRHTGWPRGFAHADFLDIESATKAFETLSQHKMNGRLLRVDYAQHRPRNST